MHNVKDKEVNEDVEFVLIGAGKNENEDLAQTIQAPLPRPPQNRHGLHVHRPGEAAAGPVSSHVQGQDGEQRPRLLDPGCQGGAGGRGLEGVHQVGRVRINAEDIKDEDLVSQD